MTLKEITLSTADAFLQLAIQNVKNGKWTNGYGGNSMVDTFVMCKNEFTAFRHENGKLLVYETRLVISKLQKKAVSFTHVGYQEIVCTEQLLFGRGFFFQVEETSMSKTVKKM